MKRIISVGFSTLMLLGIFGVMNIIPVMVVSANDPVWVVDHWETSGDWVIDASSTVTTFTGISINVNGNLTITPGYTLELISSTLTMNGTSNGQFNITVQPLGNFLIKDTDNNPLTPGDVSVIKGNSSYGFVVEGPNGYLEMENSELHECGWSNLDPDWEDAGLNIQGVNSIVSGNDISSNFRGVIVHGAMASGSTIENNTIYDNSATGLWVSMGSTNNHIADNEIYNNQFGIRINSSINSQTNYIINNNIHENAVTGIIFEDSSNFHVEGNDILNHTGSTGIFIWDSQGITVHDNFLDGNGGAGGVDEYSTIFSEGSTGVVITNNYITNSNQYGMRAQYQPDIVVENNQFVNNLGGGAIVIFVEITNNGLVNNNSVINSGFHGIFVDGCNNFKVTNNTIDSVGVATGVGIVNQNFYSASTLKVYIYNNDVTNIGTGNEGVGMTLNSGTDHVVDSNYFDTITSHGMYIQASDNLIQNNVISNVGSSLSANNFPDVSGIVLEGDRNTFINNTISNCQSIAGSNYVAGFQFGYSASATYPTNTVIKDSLFSGNEINVRSEDANGAVTNTIIENSTLVADGDTAYDFYLVEDAHITTLNTTFDNSSVSIDATSNLTVKWFVNVNVKNGGTGQDGAEVRIQNILGNDEPSGQPFTTQTIDTEPGWVKWIPLTEYVQEGSTKTFYTNHWINVTWSTKEGLARPKMWTSQDIIIDLNERPIILDFQRGASSVFRGDTIYMFINATDLPEDYESEFEGEVYYRDPGNLYWNTTYLGPVFYDDTNGNGNDDVGFWFVAFTPPIDAPLGDYDFRARVKDTYGSWSDWEIILDSFGVNVKNNPPYVEGMYNITINGSAGSGKLYRGGNAWIYGDGNDVENGDDQNFTDAKFEWSNDGGLTWEDIIYWNPPTPTTGGGNWYQNFEPPKQIDTPVGLYQFRVKFQDEDGEWGPWESLEDLNILNNPPKFEDFTVTVSEILRGGATVRIFVNASDFEESEEDLTVEFFYQHSTQGTGWEQGWLSLNGNWDTGTSRFYADFTPPNSAEAGFYDFRVDITDQYAPSVPGDTDSRDLGPQINVLNNPPNIVNVKASLNDARAGIDTVFIHINATDDFNSESQLKIEAMEWRQNNTVSPGAWDTDQSKIEINMDQGYVSSGGGYIRGSMKPTDDTSVFMGDYDIRLKVRDLENGKTNWVYLYNAFTVTTVVPYLFDITLQKTELFRDETTYITLNASDLSQAESTLTVEIYYKLEDDTFWTLMDVQPEHYQGTNDLTGYWKIPFSPDRNWDDEKLGTYEFQARVGNDVPVYSNDGNYNSSNKNCDVKNNIPEAKSIAADADTVERGSTIIIYATGEDVETNEDDLDPTFKYRLDESSWSTISNPDYNDGRWEVEFTPDNALNLGYYSFKVMFYDGLNPSNEIVASDIVDVTNAKPVATSLLVAKSSASRMEEIKLTAVVSDADQDEDTLIPNFQYMGPNDSDWVSQSTSNYFKNANYLGNNQWEIIFSPPTTADIGDYNFRVEFTDNAGISCDPLDGTQTLTLENSDPEVTITSPTPGSKDKTDISFDATGIDDEDSTLTWHWEFGDGEESDQEKPTHTYSGPGDYEIKVTVTDSDKGTATHSVTITISEDTGFPLMFILLIVILVVVVVLILFVLLKNKKKPEEVPPQTDATMAQAPEQPALQPEAVSAAPQAAAPPIAQQPQAPVAAPVAAALAGGQQIKCPKCSIPFTVTDPTRPITIECPNCGAKGTLK